MAVLYYHPNGDDSAAGTSPATARKSLVTNGSSPASTANASTRFLNGDTILLARGGIWQPDAANMGVRFMFESTVTTHNGQYIGSYTADMGDDAPLLDGLLYDDGPSGWTYTSAGRWEKNFSATGYTALNGRAWPDRTGPASPLNRQAFRLVASAAAVTAEGLFYVTGTTATFYTGASGAGNDPFTKFGGLCFAARWFGSSGGTIFRTGSWLGEEVRDGIIFRGGTAQWRNNNDSVRLIDVESQCIGVTSGLVIASAENESARSWLIKNFCCDAYTSSSEDRGTSAGWGSQNGIALHCNSTAGTSVVSDVEIVDANIRGMRHFSINVQNESDVADTRRGITVRATRPGVSSIMNHTDVDYGRTIGMGASGFLFHGIVSRGARTNDQFRGSGVISANIWEDLREGVAEVNNQGLDNAVSIASHADQHSTTSIDFCDNIIVNPWNYALILRNTLTNGFSPGSVRAFNNTIIDLAHYLTGRTSQEAGTYPGFPGCIFAYAASNPTSFIPQLPSSWNNVFVIPSGQSTIYVQGDGVTTGAFFDPGNNSGLSRDRAFQRTANDAAISPQPFSNQVFHSVAGAGLDSRYRPNSSCGLYRTGTHVAYGTDAEGKARWNPPTVGALEAA